MRGVPCLEEQGTHLLVSWEMIDRKLHPPLGRCPEAGCLGIAASPVCRWPSAAVVVCKNAGIGALDACHRLTEKLYEISSSPLIRAMGECSLCAGARLLVHGKVHSYAALRTRAFPERNRHPRSPLDLFFCCGLRFTPSSLKPSATDDNQNS